MIKSIKLEVPEYGVSVDHQFEKGLNLIEAPNGYGKTTILYALLSIYSGKFRTSKIPAANATVVTDTGTLILNKGLWVGKNEEPNPLAKFVLAGEFFGMTTPEQRGSIVKLLDIDYAGFMREAVPEWTDKLETELNRSLTFNEGKEEALLQDLVKLRAEVIDYEKNPVEIVDNTGLIETAWANTVRPLQQAAREATTKNSDVAIANARRTNNIAACKAAYETLKENYVKASNGTNCSNCGQPLPEAKRQELLDELKKKGKAAAEELKKAEAVPVLEAVPVPDYPTEPDLEGKSKITGIAITKTSQEDFLRRSSYITVKGLVASKEKELRALGELDVKEKLELIAKTKRSFTEGLNVKVKDLGLEIELFKVQKNGDVVESFVISKNGIPYSDLSNGNKAVLQFRISKAFADNLGIPFVLVDEAGTLSSSSVKEIKDSAGDTQVIMVRAAPFTKKDMK